MSSHHVIRENQEAAVAILDIERCSFEILGDALEWSPLVIAKAEVTAQLIDRGYKIDLVFSRDQHEFDQQTLQQRHITFLKQRENELQQTMELAYKRHHPGVIIFTSFDENVINKIAQPPLPVSIIDGTKKWTLIMSGEFKKWFSKGDTYQLKGGVVKINSGQTAKSINNVEADGMVVLKSKKTFWLGESLI